MRLALVRLVLLALERLSPLDLGPGVQVVRFESDGALVVSDAEPAAFCKIVASLMPRDVNLNIGVDAAAFVEKFRTAQALLGNADAPKVINGR